MKSREPSGMAVWLLLAAAVVTALMPACSSPDDPEEGSAVPSTDFFPPLAVGDTLSWDYLYYDIQTGVLMDWLEGRMRWTVTAVDSAAGSKVTSVRQEFTGLLTKHRSDTPYLRDSIWIPSDTTGASLNEDASHTVSVTTRATGRYASYGGRVVSFQRFPTGVQGDTLQVTTSGGGGGYGNTVKAKRGFGLVYYYDWSGPGMTQYRTTMTRR